MQFPLDVCRVNGISEIITAERCTAKLKPIENYEDSLTCDRKRGLGVLLVTRMLKRGLGTSKVTRMRKRGAGENRSILGLRFWDAGSINLYLMRKRFRSASSLTRRVTITTTCQATIPLRLRVGFASYSASSSHRTAHKKGPDESGPNSGRGEFFGSGC